jgi:adenylate kinase family enzyme
MRRVSVIGSAGSGKSTLAHGIASRIGASVVELDHLYWVGPGWTHRPPEAFRSSVADVVAGDRWVIDGNYGSVQDLVWSRADTVVWLDPPRSAVMWQVIKRTVRRVVTREELWNGIREPWSNLYAPWGSDSIIRWSWDQHADLRRRYPLAMADPANSHLTFHHLRSRQEAAALLARVEQVA